jgi:hypothetical protein
VILRGDQHASRLDFLHRVIPAPVSVGHLRRRSAESQAQ